MNGDTLEKLVAHPKWKWEPGMGLGNGQIVASLIGTAQAGVFGLVTSTGEHRSACDMRPDIDHPATKGWLLAMLREATGAGCYTTEPALPLAGAEWEVWDYRNLVLGIGPTEGAALASALLAVWGEP